MTDVAERLLRAGAAMKAADDRKRGLADFRPLPKEAQ